MSYYVETVHGLGFDVEETQPEKYIEFLNKHKDTLKKCYVDCDKVLECVNEYALEPDDLDYDDVREITKRYSIAEPVAAIMQEELNIYFDTPGLTDTGRDFVIYTPSYPWQMTKEERNLTCEMLAQLMERYASELDVPFEFDVDLYYEG